MAAAVAVSTIPRLPPLPSLRDLMKLYNLRALRQLSQNFLLDEKITNKFVKSVGNIRGKYVCEVGPGPGGITRALLRQNPEKLVLIEKDTRFKPMLRLLSDCCPGVIQPYWGDVLSFNLTKAFPESVARRWDSDELPPVHLVGNLPFSIASPLIIKWLKSISEQSNVWEFGRVPLTLTFQLEVAERIVANLLDEERSRLSIMSQYLTEPRIKFVIKGSAFVPKPDVDVGVVQFTPLERPRIQHPFDVVEKVVRQLFHLKNKYSWRGASTLFPLVLREKLGKEMYERAEIALETRVRHLSVEECGRLVDAYVKICENYPVRNYEHQAHKADEEWEKQYGHIFGYKRLTDGGSAPEAQFDYADEELERAVSSDEVDVPSSSNCTVAPSNFGSASPPSFLFSS